ncbi:glycosyltransferase family 2 protein [Akkermansiaceae bacterium]|nr:glycosyltransferase family 2 protein [Akkermansiaceae bacterium]
MPAYNRAELIEEALDSVKSQTYRPIQLIIVDDGSTDNTAEIVQKWKDENDENSTFQVEYYYQENAGSGAARNRGIKEICGEYVQFFDSDDLIPPDRLQKLERTFLNENCDFIQTGFEGFCADCGEVIEVHHANPDVGQFVLALRGRLWANTLRCAMRSELVRNSPPWDEEMTCFEDYKYVVGVLCNARKCIATPEILASARRGGGPRVSDRLKTHEGRGFRIRCEEEVVRGLAIRKDIDPKEIQQFASRLYSLGFRSAASGWPDLAKKCGRLADSLGVELDGLGKRRKLIFKLGPWAARIYECAHSIKAKISRNVYVPNPHECQVGSK